ncbi:hypothetical protein Ciccas_002483 [Cichlidogyrus casuarinus]|uniref:MHD1 domain-containing protein n=1 Tax=Cichlidogyrus casuarinus TaxID=1844966 RepID=A0ABD2QH48_9PLAT
MCRYKEATQTIRQMEAWRIVKSYLWDKASWPLELANQSIVNQLLASVKKTKGLLKPSHFKDVIHEITDDLCEKFVSFLKDDAVKFFQCTLLDQIQDHSVIVPDLKIMGNKFRVFCRVFDP